jgi:hypothetical protein
MRNSAAKKSSEQATASCPDDGGRFFQHRTIDSIGLKAIITLSTITMAEICIHPKLLG